MDERNKDIIPEGQSQEDMTQPESVIVEETIYTTPDVYQTQTGQEVYQTPDTSVGYYNSGGLFSGEQSENGVEDSQTQYVSGEYNVVNQNQYGNSGMPVNQYRNQYGNNDMSGNQYRNQYGNNGMPANQYQYGNQYGYNGAYSPYATPDKKKNTGLIIGIVSVAAVFMFAFLAIIYSAFKNIANSINTNVNNGTYSDSGNNNDNGSNRDNRSNSGDRSDNNHNYRDDEEDKDNDKDIDDDRDSDNDYDEDDYYEFHDEIKSNLSYSIDWDYFDYDTDEENVSITVDYPIIVGDDVPNLDKLNAIIERETSIFTEYYEEKYAKHMGDNDDSYFNARSQGYVTYMSENVLSIAFQEEIQSNYFGAVYVYSINIDMNTGVIMDNTEIIDADDDFSVDFRIRSEKQNGVSDELDDMSDQEITRYLNNADNLIIFYTPQGMEIGINYDDGYGWITVTYHDYKKYLKVY